MAVRGLEFSNPAKSVQDALLHEAAHGWHACTSASRVIFRGVLTMSKTIRFHVALTAAILSAGVMSFAQAGQATYKAKCQSCHGAEGIPNPGIAKAMGVKPATDPSVVKMSEADMIAATKNGMGKMQPFKDKLTDDQIKDSVDYFRTFAK
jgi:cytochrome c553